jgi:hypothetical protein
MRRARCLPTRRSRSSRTAALLGLILTSWGCQQPPSYFYFGSGAPACRTVVPEPAAPVKGRAGEPSTEVIEGGVTAVEAPGRTTTVIGSEAPPRVVLSEPETPSRGSWRPKADADTTLATSVDGATTTNADPSVVR